MIDNFSILLSHTLLIIAYWILIQRADTDAEDPPAADKEAEGFAHQRPHARPVSRGRAGPGADDA